MVKKLVNFQLIQYKSGEINGEMSGEISKDEIAF